MKKTSINDSQLDNVSAGSMIPYQVQPGDTIARIAQKFGVSMEQIMKWNNIKDPNFIMVGQQLQIKF